MDVYINDVSAFLPNRPVGNDEIENVLGQVHDIPSRVKRVVLRNNKIETRYYAIDPDTGHMTHSNAQLAAEAANAPPRSPAAMCLPGRTPDQPCTVR